MSTVFCEFNKLYEYTSFMLHKITLKGCGFVIKINALQKENELLLHVIYAAVRECNLDSEVFSDERKSADIAILSDASTAKSCNSKIFITPNSKTIKTTASEIITYGLCCKNTLTISSFIENNMVLSLQRTIRTITGKQIEAQDFSITVSDKDEPELVLAAVSLLLVADVPIYEISRLSF